MLVDEDMEVIAATMENTSAPSAGPAAPQSPSAIQIAEEMEIQSDNREATMRQTRRVFRNIATDQQTALRNTELAYFNNEYVQNMAAARNQKMRNKLLTQAKKNAGFWVIGQGIGSVGVGLGTSHVQHPLHFFSGETLYDALVGAKKSNKRKGPDTFEDDSGADSEARRVRRREESEEQVGRGGLFTGNENFHDVRHKPVFPVCVDGSIG